MSKKIIIVGGDPNSINSEIIHKSLKKINIKIKKRIYLIANYDLIYKQFKRLNYKTSFIKVKNIEDNVLSNKIKVIDIPLNFKNPFKVSLNNASKYVIKSLNLAKERRSI